MGRSTADRGYGAAHRRERARWAALLESDGPVPCAKGCGRLIHHGSRWDLGHTDDRTGWTGPECIPCNRGAGGRNGAAVTNAARTTTFREW